MLGVSRILALATLANVTVLFVSAGFIVEDNSALGIHGFGGIMLHIFTGLLAVSLSIRAWLSKTGLAQAGIAVVLFALTFPQAALGSYMTMPMHVTGALILTLLAAWLTAWTLLQHRLQPTHQDQPASTHEPTKTNAHV